MPEPDACCLVLAFLYLELLGSRMAVWWYWHFPERKERRSSCRSNLFFSLALPKHSRFDSREHKMTSRSSAKHAHSAISRVLVVAVLSCMVWKALGGTQMSDDQPCAGLLGQVKSSDILVKVNGTRYTFHLPTRKNGPFNDAPTLFLEVPGIRQQNRTGKDCSRLTDRVVASQTFTGCSCTLIPIDTIEQGAHKFGYELLIDRCPSPQENLVTRAYSFVTNDTISELYTNTMQYSSLPNFTYSNPYVEASYSEYQKKTGLGAPVPPFLSTLSCIRPTILGPLLPVTNSPAATNLLFFFAPPYSTQ